MRKQILAFVIPAIILLGLLGFFAFNRDVVILNPQGLIAEQQRNLFVFTVMLSLIVVVPVFVLLFTIAWRFRAENKQARYRPKWDNNHILEAVWWGIPVAIIIVLGVITWQTSHSLDPYKPLDTKDEPIAIQVVSLQWKWLFIYPEQKIATVNEFIFPEKRHISLKLTSDAPMNSFWLPALAGQIYTMNGMSTSLHILANKPGIYNGVSANISGEGFSNMRFRAKVVSQEEYDEWVASVDTFDILTDDDYIKLAEPSIISEDRQDYSLPDSGLYDRILMQYMSPVKILGGDRSEIESSKKKDDMTKMEMP